MGNFWFKRRRYGYGWVPVTWQGWTVLIIWLAVVVGASFQLVNQEAVDGDPEYGFYSVTLLLATTALLFICRRKGPKPKWRWGVKPNDNPNEDY